MKQVGFGRRAVAIGGGTGLPVVLRCLLDLGFDTSAVVTMADDGGSTGVLRRQLGMLPPGDIRNCLVAMSEDPDGLAAQTFQYRFGGGDGLAGHALGNLILVALADITRSFPEAIERVGQALGARGKVLPSTLADVTLHATDRNGDAISGQARIATSETAVARVRLDSHDAPAYPPALEAIAEADVIVIGPGSLYTSIIPNFLIREVRSAVLASAAPRVYVCNVANMRGETAGLDAVDHLRALADHGLAGAIDIAVIGRGAPDAGAIEAEGVQPVAASAAELDRLSELATRIVTAELADPADPVRHDFARLCAVLEEVLG